MVGIVVVAHGSLSNELIGTTKMIIGEELAGVVGGHPGSGSTGWQSLSLGRKSEIKRSIRARLVVFTVLFGGSPSNMPSFLKDQVVEVICGVNLRCGGLIYSREEKPSSTQQPNRGDRPESIRA
jgi:mannose/fructose-specific phosphotransferase system component IIA